MIHCLEEQLSNEASTAYKAELENEKIMNDLFNFFVETGLYSTCHSKLPSLFITLFEFTPPFFFTQ
jgi:hypothetical protein